MQFEASDRLVAAADEWADKRMSDREDALETKVEQALLEVEHLVSGEQDVEFDVDERTVTYEPTDALAAFLDQQAESVGVDPADVLAMHADLFATVFLDNYDQEERPPNAPPTE
ncbi:hypothetical protein [Halobacterium noricense]|uniref:hypothetical protein n=1 Tax=Halobacterium noricense TaxID=223182 RepID=UPI001E5544A6|nr:hypothetical protein [Halobacterium noricense]UHH26173.1 hypothetical protein LT974_04375 [Halobacterium noricense]